MYYWQSKNTRKLFGTDSNNKLPKGAEETGTFVVDYCTILTPQQAKLARLFIIVSKKLSNTGMSLLDACHITYALRDGYFAACTKAVELTLVQHPKLSHRKEELCSKVHEIAQIDEDIKSLVVIASAEEASEMVKRVEATLMYNPNKDSLGGSMCSYLDKDGIKSANGLVLRALENGYDLRKSRACACFLALLKGSLEDCALTLRSALHNLIPYDMAETLCFDMGQFAGNSVIPSEKLIKRAMLEEEQTGMSSVTRQRAAANEAIVTALAIHNRCYLDANDVRQILFTDFPASENVVDRRALFNRFKNIYIRRKNIAEGRVPVFAPGILTPSEIKESSKVLEEGLEPIDLNNNQALRILFITYRNLIESFKETQQLIQDLFFQRRNVADSLKKRFYYQIQLIKYLETHIGALSQYISENRSDISPESNLPTALSNLKLYASLNINKEWGDPLFDRQQYENMDHFALFCSLLHRSAFRLALLVVGIAHSVLHRTKVKLPDACLAISQMKEGRTFRFSIQLALTDVFIANQKIMKPEDLDPMYHLLVDAVDESVNNFLLGVPGDLLETGGKNDIDDENLNSWLAQTEHRIKKILDDPKQILGDISLFDVDMIMQSITQKEARIQLLVSVAVSRIHRVMMELTNEEINMRNILERLDTARRSGISSDEVEMNNLLNQAKHKRNILIHRIIDLTAYHASICVRAIDIFDIADRPIVRKVYRLVAVNAENKRLYSQYTKLIQNPPLYKSNKYLLRVSILKHRKDQAMNVLINLSLGPLYDPFDSRWYTDYNSCFSNDIPKLPINLIVDPTKYLERYSGFIPNTPDKCPPKYTMYCNDNQLRRFKQLQDDIAKLLKQLKVPNIQFESKKTFAADILNIEGWSPLGTTISEKESFHIPCTIAKQIFRKIVSDISQKVKGGSSFFTMPLMNFWCANYIRFRLGNQDLWRNLISRVWLIFLDEPLAPVELQKRKWRLLSWFR
ncbi:hypothetical protein ACR3K2_27230 [Cryptosporidium serpentis]